MIKWRNKDQQDDLWKEGKYDYQIKDEGVTLKYAIIKDFIESHFSANDKLRILDIGAGEGEFYFRLKQYIALYHYMDISPEAKRRFQERKPGNDALISVGDFDGFVFVNMYDIICFLGYLQEFFSIEKIKKVFQENLENGFMIIEGLLKTEFVPDVFFKKYLFRRIEYSYTNPESNKPSLYNRVAYIFKK